MEDLLTIAEISRRTGIPESNLRYYRNKYIDYIPCVGVGKKRRYKPEALDVFKLIADLLNEGRTANDIAVLLERRITKTIDVTSETATTTTIKPQLDIFEILSKQQQQIDELTAHQQRLEQQLDNHYKLVDERLRQLMQPSQLQAKKPWYKRLFSDS